MDLYWIVDVRDIKENANSNRFCKKIIYTFKPYFLRWQDVQCLRVNLLLFDFVGCYEMTCCDLVMYWCCYTRCVDLYNQVVLFLLTEIYYRDNTVWYIENKVWACVLKQLHEFVLRFEETNTWMCIIKICLFLFTAINQS